MKSLKENPPNFLRTDEQFSYYIQVIDLLVLAQVPIRDQDSFAIGTLALNLALLDDCANSLSEHGMMMNVNNGRGGVQKINPAIAMQKEAQTALRYYYDRFQMSPSSRGNGIGGGLQPKPKDDKGGIGGITVNNKG